MQQRHRSVTHRSTTVACALLLAACGGTGEGGGGTAGQTNQGGQQSSGAPGMASAGAEFGANGGAPMGAGGSVETAGSDSVARNDGDRGAGASNGGTRNHQPENSADGGASGSVGHGGGNSAGASGGNSAGAGGGNSAGAGGGTIIGSCVGKALPNADPTKLGPFATATDKGVGPVAGAPNDPIHGDTPVRFNVYRPKELESGGYCFPIVIWSNGHGDQPEPSPPECVLNKCGHYSTVMQQFASHGFVVVVSMSSQTSQGNPVPSLTGLDWIVSQSNDPASPYYHHLDTAHIGAAGHSEGGFTTCGKMASDPRISAISTVSGASANPAIHQPTLLVCGGKDPTVSCTSVSKTFDTITGYPAMLLDNLSVNHVNWTTQGANGPSIAGLIAWFRVQLMGDSENRKYFYGPSCTFCGDSRVTVMRNSLMLQ